MGCQRGDDHAVACGDVPVAFGVAVVCVRGGEPAAWGACADTLNSGPMVDGCVDGTVRLNALVASECSLIRQTAQNGLFRHTHGVCGVAARALCTADEPARATCGHTDVTTAAVRRAGEHLRPPVLDDRLTRWVDDHQRGHTRARDAASADGENLGVLDATELLAALLALDDRARVDDVALSGERVGSLCAGQRASDPYPGRSSQRVVELEHGESAVDQDITVAVGCVGLLGCVLVALNQHVAQHVDGVGSLCAGPRPGDLNSGRTCEGVNVSFCRGEHRVDFNRGGAGEGVNVSFCRGESAGYFGRGHTSEGVVPDFRHSHGAGDLNGRNTRERVNVSFCRGERASHLSSGHTCERVNVSFCRGLRARDMDDTFGRNRIGCLEGSHL